MNTPRFEKTYCSQCGREFGPGDHGYSHCADHQNLEDYDARLTNDSMRQLPNLRRRLRQSVQIKERKLL